MADILQVNTELPADFTSTPVSGLEDEGGGSPTPKNSHPPPRKTTPPNLGGNIFTALYWVET